MSMPHGLCVVGRFVGVEAVRYGDRHEKAGQDVPNFYRLVVEVDHWGGGSHNESVTFNWADRDTGETLRPARSVDESGATPGDIVALRVRVKDVFRKGGKVYPEYELLRVDVVESARQLAAVGE